MIYLDNAATTFPKPQEVIRESCRCMESYCGNPGRGSHRMAVRASEALFRCRAAAAELLGCPQAERVAFTLNATYALNMAIKGLVPPGSHVVISDMEHNSVLRPVEKLRTEYGVSYSVFSTGGGEDAVINSLCENIKENTSAVICLHASNLIGRVLPAKRIGDICRERGIKFILDASQSAGTVPINADDWGVDVLCAPGHKGLLGPQGIGIMVFGSDLNVNTLVEGGSGADSSLTVMPEYLPDRMEAGTMPTPAAAGLLRGIEYVLKRGERTIAANEKALAAYVRRELERDGHYQVWGDGGNDFEGGLLLITDGKRSPQKLGAALDSMGICVRSGLHCAPLAHKTLGTPEGGGVRVSFGPFNTKKHADALLSALSALKKGNL